MKEENKIKISDYSTLMLLVDEHKKHISDFIKETIDEDDIADKKNLPDYAENGIITNSHVTILFGIREEEPIETKKYIDNDNIRAVLGKTKIFENDFTEYDVLVLDVLSKDIRALNKTLVENLDHAKSPFEFNPHLTLAYLKKGTGKKYKGLDNLEGKIIDSKQLVFSSKNGKKYKIQL